MCDLLTPSQGVDNSEDTLIELYISIIVCYYETIL